MSGKRYRIRFATTADAILEGKDIDWTTKPWTETNTINAAYHLTRQLEKSPHLHLVRITDAPHTNAPIEGETSARISLARGYDPMQTPEEKDAQLARAREIMEESAK